MPLRILDLPILFRPGTSIVYPPFKKGRYLEEYIYEYMLQHAPSIESDCVYIPIFWTHLQNHPGFKRMKDSLTLLLQKEIQKMPKQTKYFTIVQHDDGPMLPLPKDTLLFGACTGTIPIPLIYEDTTHYLMNRPRTQNKDWLASFIGTLTHPVREHMKQCLEHKPSIYWMTKPREEWTNRIAPSAADVFVEATLQSKFCLAPRGYGRSSFRFFEAMLLDTVPVYFWDDQEWLPYKEFIDYSIFAISIQEKDIPKTYDILTSISEETYQSMVENIRKVRHHFTLEGVGEYIRKTIELHSIAFDRIRLH